MFSFSLYGFLSVAFSSHYTSSHPIHIKLSRFLFFFSLLLKLVFCLPTGLSFCFMLIDIRINVVKQKGWETGRSGHMAFLCSLDKLSPLSATMWASRQLEACPSPRWAVLPRNYSDNII